MIKRFYALLIRTGFNPDHITYGVMIALYGRTQNTKKVEALFDEMAEKGIEPDLVTFNILLTTFTKGFNAKKAEKIFTKMKSRGIIPDRKTYMSLAEMYAMLSDEEGVREMIRQMLGQKAANLRTERTMLELYCSLGLIGLVRESLMRLEANLDQPDKEIFYALMKGYRVLGDVDRVGELRQEMKALGFTPPLF